MIDAISVVVCRSRFALGSQASPIPPCSSVPPIAPPGSSPRVGGAERPRTKRREAAKMAHPAQPSAPVLRVLLALAQLAAARGYNEWTLVAAVDRNRWCAPPARFMHS